MRFLPVVALGLIGCLPAYDNAIQALATDAGPSDMGQSSDGPICNPSGKFMAGIVFSAEKGTAVPGTVVYLDGYSDAKFSSAPADSLGHFKLEIPDCVFGAGGSARYLVMEGSATSIPLTRTWLGPATYGKAETPEGTGFHVFENPTDPTKGSKHLVVKELVAAGLFPSEAEFNTKYSYLQSALVSVAGGLTRYNKYAIQVEENGAAVDNTGCSTPGKAATQCCVYYLSGLYDDFINNRSGPTYVKLGDTVANGYNFVVTCPGQGAAAGTKAREVTLKQTEPTSSLRDSFQKPPNADFPPIVVPVVVGDVVGLEWYIYL